VSLKWKDTHNWKPSHNSHHKKTLSSVCVSTHVHASNTETLHLANKYAHFYPDSHNTLSNQRYICMHIVRKSSLNISCILCLYYSHYKHVNMEDMITTTYFVEIYVLKLFSVLYKCKCFVNHENKQVTQFHSVFFMIMVPNPNSSNKSVHYWIILSSLYKQFQASDHEIIVVQNCLENMCICMYGDIPMNVTVVMYRDFTAS